MNSKPSLESLLQEIEADKPGTPPALLTKAERYRHIERAILGLYRWYVSYSQRLRNWNPDRDFDWRQFKTDHSDNIVSVIEGFFAVEQYTPDYVTTILHMIRRSHGRSHYMMRWGSEEEKHADLWRNALMATGRRGVQWVEDYMEILRGKEWKLPFEDPLRILFYQVVQERATQVNYLNMALIAQGQLQPEKFGADADFVLAEVSRKIAVDEAAHYKFFQEIFRLFLYYVPDEAAEAALDVVNHFYMPASDIIPDFNVFVEALRKTSVYGGRQYAVDVLEPAFRSMGIANRKTLEAAVRRSREVPDTQGGMRSTAIFDSLDFHHIEDSVKKTYHRIGLYEKDAGIEAFSNVRFVPNGYRV
jgi:acyl-[acyl-carrier-protein] desaturase